MFNPISHFDPKDFLKAEYNKFRRHVYVIVYGTDTVLGRLFDITLLAFIIVSVLLIMLESVESINDRFHTALSVMEWIITVFFTIEYALRIISNNKPLSYIFSFYGIVDLVSILPMYLSFFIPGSNMLLTIRVFRLLRLFRVLDLVNFTSESNKLIGALKASRAKIMVFIYFMVIICVFLGTIMYMVESRESGFSSIPRSIYWCVVTLTTVGYGDIAPSTTLGQMIATMIMIMGYGIIAVPTGIVSAQYTKDINRRKMENKKICPACKSQNHATDAIYCNKCGTILQNTPL